MCLEMAFLVLKFFCVMHILVVLCKESWRLGGITSALITKQERRLFFCYFHTLVFLQPVNDRFLLVTILFLFFRCVRIPEGIQPK